MNLLHEAFVWLSASFGQWWYWLVVLVGFFVHVRIEHVLNGSETIFRKFLADLREDFLWAILGSRHRRGEFIRDCIERCGSSESLLGGGVMGGYSYKQIRTQNLYEVVGVKMLPGPLNFWSRVIGWALWPLAGVLILLVMFILWALHGVLLLCFGKQGAENLYDKVFDFFDDVPKNSSTQ